MSSVVKKSDHFLRSAEGEGAVEDRFFLGVVKISTEVTDAFKLEAVAGHGPGL